MMFLATVSKENKQLRNTIRNLQNELQYKNSQIKYEINHLILTRFSSVAKKYYILNRKNYKERIKF